MYKKSLQNKNQKQFCVCVGFFAVYLANCLFYYKVLLCVNYYVCNTCSVYI